MAIKAFEAMGATRIWNPDRCYFVIDHAAPAPNESIQISGNFEPPKNDPPQDPQKPPQDPPADPTKAKVAVYAQDPYVDGPMIMDVPKAEIGADLQSDRAKIRDNREREKRQRGISPVGQGAVDIF